VLCFRIKKKERLQVVIMTSLDARAIPPIRVHLSVSRIDDA
jgi:hypothetical protein